MPPVGNFGRGKINILSLASVGFLVISLVSIVSFTNNPIKTQAVKIFAWIPEGFDKPEQDTNRPGAEEREKREKEADVAPQVETSPVDNINSILESLGNTSDAQERARLLEQIKSYYDQGKISGDIFNKATSIAKAQDVISQINGSNDSLEIEKYFRLLQTYVDQNTISKETYDRIVSATDARLLISDVYKSDSAQEKAPLLDQLKSYASQDIISQEQYRSALLSGTVQSIVEVINKETDPIKLEKLYSQLKTYADQNVISDQYYKNIISSTDARLLISDIGKAGSKEERLPLLTRLKSFADQGVITQNTYNEVSKYYTDQGELNPQTATQNVTVEKTDLGFERTYTTIVKDTSGNLITARSSGVPDPAIGKDLLLTAINESQTQKGKDALAQLQKLYPDLVELAKSAIDEKTRDAFIQAQILRDAGNYTTQPTLKTYTIADLERRLCLTDPSCYTKLSAQEAPQLGPISQDLESIRNLLSFGTNEEYRRLSELYGPGSVQAQGAALKSFTVGSVEAVPAIIGGLYVGSAMVYAPAGLELFNIAQSPAAQNIMNAMSVANLGITTYGAVSPSDAPYHEFAQSWAMQNVFGYQIDPVGTVQALTHGAQVMADAGYVGFTVARANVAADTLLKNTGMPSRSFGEVINFNKKFISWLYEDPAYLLARAKAVNLYMDYMPSTLRPAQEANLLTSGNVVDAAFVPESEVAQTIQPIKSITQNPKNLLTPIDSAPELAPIITSGLNVSNDFAAIANSRELAASLTVIPTPPIGGNLLEIAPLVNIGRNISLTVAGKIYNPGSLEEAQAIISAATGRSASISPLGDVTYLTDAPASQIPSKTTLTTSPKVVPASQIATQPQQNVLQRVGTWMDEHITPPIKKVNTPDLSERSKVSKYLTGYTIDQSEPLLAKLETDQAQILGVYNLPNPQLKRTDPDAYLKQVTEIAQKNNIPVKPISDVPAGFADKIPQVSAFYDEAWGTKTVYVKDPTSKDARALGKLTHEVIHGLDYKNNPDLPIATKEYRAYVGEYNLSNLRNQDGQIDKTTLGFIFGEMGIGGSTTAFLQQQGIQTLPWDQPTPNALQKVGAWINDNIINPPLRIVPPAFTKFTDIVWRGFRSPEGKLQWPIGKVTPSTVTQQTVSKITPEPYELNLQTLGDTPPWTEEGISNALAVYHGSQKPISIKLDYVYNWDEIGDSGSETLGTAFYATFNKSIANDYATLRAEETGVVNELFVYDAKILDLRVDPSNLDAGTKPLPKGLVQEWLNYVNSIKDKRVLELGTTPGFLRLHQKWWDEYTSHLRTILDSGEKLDLRAVLQTYDLTFPSPDWSTDFRNFMLSKGIDGVIYIERGDNPSAPINDATLAIYNYNKIGTQTDWAARVTQNQPTDIPAPIPSQKNWINDNIINPPLGIIEPNMARLMNLEPVYAWRGFRNPETGRFQLPIGKIVKTTTESPSTMLQVSADPVPGYLPKLTEARKTGEPITLYKGIQNFDPDIGAILPGGLSQTPNTNKSGATYPVGKGRTLNDVKEAFRHALLGDTSQSGFSSWTPKIKTALMYAGKNGTVVSTTISLRDPRVIDLAPLIDEQGVILDNSFRDIWTEVVKTETIKVARTEDLPVKKAAAEASGRIFRNGANTLRSNEILIQGYVPDYKILSAQEINQIKSQQSVLVDTPPTDIAPTILDVQLSRVVLNEELDPVNYSSKDLIEYFSEALGPLYNESVGVWEGYSLGQHTKMVLDQFDRYFSRSPLPGNVDVGFMRTFLALHDAGKPTAVIAGDKSLQYKYTIAVLERVLNGFGFSQPQINLAVALVNGDPIGNTLKTGDIAANAAKIVESALNAGISAEDYFELLTIYYKVDAGSYTLDAGGLESLDELFVFNHEKGTLGFAPEQQALIDELRSAVVNSLPTVIQKAKATINQVLNPPLGIVPPAFTKFTDIVWRGFINPDGKLQWPIGKVSTSPATTQSQITPIAISKSEALTALSNPEYKMYDTPVITVQQTAPDQAVPLEKSSFFANSDEPQISGFEGEADLALQRTIASKGFLQTTGEALSQTPDQLSTLAAPTAGRSDFILLEKPLTDYSGIQFPVLQRKGVGTVRQVLADRDALKLFGAPAELDPKKYPSIGNTYLYGYKLDLNVTSLWLQNRLRVRTPYRAYELQTVFDGSSAVKLEGDESNPQIISVWATRNPFTMEDVHLIGLQTRGDSASLAKLISSTLKNQAYFLQFESTDPTALSLSRSLITDPETNARAWIDWMASRYGTQAAAKTNTGLLSGEMHRQNLSLGVEFRDLGDNPNYPKLEKYKTSPVPFDKINDSEYENILVKEVFEILGGVINTAAIVNDAYGYSHINELRRIATEFFEAFSSASPETFNRFFLIVQDNTLYELAGKTFDLYGFAYQGNRQWEIEDLDYRRMLREVIEKQAEKLGIGTNSAASTQKNPTALSLNGTPLPGGQVVYIAQEEPSFYVHVDPLQRTATISKVYIDTIPLLLNGKSVNGRTPISIGDLIYINGKTIKFTDLDAQNTPHLIENPDTSEAALTATITPRQNETIPAAKPNGLIGSGPAQFFENLAQSTIYKWLPGSAERGTIPVLIDIVKDNWRGFISSDGKFQWPFGRIATEPISLTSELPLGDIEIPTPEFIEVTDTDFIPSPEQQYIDNNFSAYEIEKTNPEMVQVVKQIMIDNNETTFLDSSAGIIKKYQITENEQDEILDVAEGSQLSFELERKLKRFNSYIDYEFFLGPSEQITDPQKKIVDRARRLLWVAYHVPNDYARAVAENSGQIQLTGFSQDPNTADVSDFLTQAFGDSLLSQTLISAINYRPNTVYIRVNHQYELPLDVFQQAVDKYPSLGDNRFRAYSNPIFNLELEKSRKFIPIPINVYNTSLEPLNNKPYLAEFSGDEKFKRYLFGTVAHEAGHHLFEYVLNDQQRSAWKKIVDSHSEPITEYAGKYRGIPGAEYEEWFTESVRIKATSSAYLAKNFQDVDRFLTLIFPTAKWGYWNSELN